MHTYCDHSVSSSRYTFVFIFMEIIFIIFLSILPCSLGPPYPLPIILSIQSYSSDIYYIFSPAIHPFPLVSLELFHLVFRYLFHVSFFVHSHWISIYFHSFVFVPLHLKELCFSFCLLVLPRWFRGNMLVSRSKVRGFKPD